MNNIVVIRNLMKKYRDHIILDNVNFKLESGKITTIFGRSGKSTLLNIIGLLESKDSGEVILFGKEAPKVGSKLAQKYLRYHISYLFQNYALLNYQSIDQNLNLVNLNPKETKKEFDKRKKLFIQKLGIKSPLNSKVGSLSGGEQQRVAVVRMLLRPGELVLCDEPTGSLDPDNRNSILKVLKYAKNMGKTILIVSHDPYIIEHSDISYNIEDLMLKKISK